jgi:hypothetical protein
VVEGLNVHSKREGIGLESALSEWYGLKDALKGKRDRIYIYIYIKDDLCEKLKDFLFFWSGIIILGNLSIGKI